MYQVKAVVKGSCFPSISAELRRSVPDLEEIIATSVAISNNPKCALFKEPAANCGRETQWNLSCESIELCVPKELLEEITAILLSHEESVTNVGIQKLDTVIDIGSGSACYDSAA